MTIFKDQVFAMRRWMKQHGYQNKPLIVTEVGILYPERFENGEPFRDELGNTYTRQRVNQFLTNTSAFLETAADQSLGYPQDNYKLVQQWAWFSMYTDGVTGSGSNLLKDGWETHGLGSESALNSTGFTFRREATNQPLVANLMLESLTSTPSTNGVRLTAMIRNNGNIAVENGYRVTFYADAALTKPIGSQTIQPILHGCATSVDTVSVNWIPPRTGWQGVWVKVDSAETVTETSERDNVKTIGVLWQ